MNLQKIKELAREKNILLKDLIDKIEMSEGAFHVAIKKNSMKAQTLEKIALELGVPISEFFENTSSVVSNTKETYTVDPIKNWLTDTLRENILSLKTQLERADKMIDLLQKDVASKQKRIAELEKKLETVSNTGNKKAS